MRVVQENSQEDENDYFSGNFLFSVPPEVWAEIKRLSEVTDASFEILANEWDLFFEKLTS